MRIVSEPDLHLLDTALSIREKEILTWVAEGRTNIQIAAALGLSQFTVKNHVQRIIKKLGASNRTDAAVRFKQTAWQQSRMDNRSLDDLRRAEAAEA